MTAVKIADRVYFTQVGSYGAGREFQSYAKAVAAARDSIERFVYFPGTPQEKVTYSRAFVALRQTSRYAGGDQVASGTDEELLRWEVYLTDVVLVPEGQGGLSDEQRDAVTA